MKLNVIVGYKEFFQPYAIPWDVLTSGFRTGTSPVPPHFASAPWAPPVTDEPRYHGALLDPANGTTDLFLEYLADIAAPSESAWLVVPILSVLDETTNGDVMSVLRRHADLVEVRAAPSLQTLLTLRQLSGRTSNERIPEFFDLESVGIPAPLMQALARNFSHHAARLAARALFESDFVDVDRAATTIATRLDDMSLRIDPRRNAEDIVDIVGRRISRFLEA